MNNLPQNPVPRQVAMRPVTALIAIATLCALVAGLVIVIFVYRTNAANYYLQLTRERQLLHTASVLRYGVVESAHPEFNAIVVRLANNFSPNAEPRLVTIQILPLTRISRQDMEQQNGVYYSLGPLLPASIADLTPGSNVALLLDTESGDSQRVVARVILTGNPL
jgi:hypothetical protein